MKRTLSLWGCVLLLASLVTNLFAFDASKTYVISNRNDVNLYMQDNGGASVALGSLNDNSYWIFEATANENCYYVKNATTGKYMQSCKSSEVEVVMGDSPVEYSIILCTAEGEGMYGMASTDQTTYNFTSGTVGCNWKGNNTVQGYAAVAGTNHRSFWKIVEAEMPAAVTLSSPYTGSTIANGDFYIYNVETGLWLQNNEKNTGDWNTRGATGTYGFDFAITAISGGYQLNPKFGNNHSMNASNFYLDTGDAVTAWTFEPKTVDGVTNAYTIKSGTQVLGLDGNDNMAWTSDKSTWQLVTREERLNYLKNNATETNPIDATFLIQDPGFANANERRSSWTTWKRDGGNQDEVRWFRNRRSYAFWNSKDEEVSQVINNIPNGIYKLQVKAFYRDGNKDDVANRRAAGTERLLAKYFINNDEKPVMSILDGASSTWIEGIFYYPAADASAPYGHYPDNADGFNRAFQDYPNNYMNEGVTSKVTTKSIYMGLKKTEANANDWLAFDEFRLAYLGPIDLTEYINGLNSAINLAEAFDPSNTTDKLKNDLNAALTDARATLSSEDPDELSAATLALTTALNNAKAVDVTILKQTITLASADGADTSAADDFVVNGTTANELSNILSALRIARRVANAEKDNNTYAGNEPAPGDFYLYNVGQKRFLCGGDDWGAHAAIGFPGIVVTLEDAGSGTYKINTHLPNGDDNGNKKEYLNFGGYCDTWTSDAWQFVEKGGGKYTIVRSNNANALLGYSNNTYNRIDTDKSGSDNLDNQWILVKKADRDALYEAAAAVTDQPASAVDVSYMIKSPNFSQREDVSAWTLTDGAAIWERGGNHPDFAVEAFDKTSASVEQTVSGLKPGTYRLKVQAFYRDGNFGNQVNVAKNGGELLQLATLYAGNKSALIQNVVNGANKAPGMGRASEVGNMPDGIDDACLYFQSGLYWATLDNLVVTSKNPSITFGARKTEKKNGGDWFVLDNFRLEYLGAYVDLSEVKAALLAKINEANTTMAGAEASFLQAAVTAGQAAMGELQDADIIVDATTALTTAINKYNAGKADLTALKQTVTKAQAEGISAFDNAVADVLAADADAFASTAAQKLYDVRAARKVNALGKDDIYTGSTPAAGKFYLYNIGTGMFLGAGSDWNTHAAVDQVGLEVEMTASGDGFTMKTPYGNFNGGAHGPYVDTDKTDVYTFTAVSGKENTYTIKQGDLVMGWNPNADTDGKRYWNTIGNIEGADVADANYQWKLITADERAALEANASSSNAVDVSYKIKNPSLNRKLGYDMWTKTGGGRVNTTDDNNGDRAADYAWEFFNADNFSFTQTVTGLKPGYYKVSVQGFYRDGNGAYQAGVVNENGELLQKAYLVGGNAQAFLPNVASAMDVVPGLTDIQATNSGNMPNWPNSSIEYFEHGAYLTTVDAKVGSNGELTIGVKKDEKPHGDDWAVIDNFRLYYLGTPLNINTMSIVGNFTGGWPDDATNDWSMAKHMTQDATDPDVWTLTIDDFYAEGKKYEYKAAANDSWEGYKLPDGTVNADFVFGTTGYPAGYYKLVFTVNTSTHNLTLDVTPKTVVTIAENETFTPADASDVTIELHRSLVANNTWNTFCVPFDISNDDLKAQFGDDVAVAEYTDEATGDNSTIKFDTMTTPAVTANVPVLLKPGIISNDNKYVFGGDIVVGEAKVAGTNFDFVGTFDASTTIEEGNYFMSANKLYKSAGATTIAGTRAYLKAAKAGARIDKFLLDGEDVTTSIETMHNSEYMHNDVFDLQGRKVNDQTKKGVYIQNGKKVVVK